MSQTLRLATVILPCLALAAVGRATRFKKQEKAIQGQPILLSRGPAGVPRSGHSLVRSGHPDRVRRAGPASAASPRTSLSGRSMAWPGGPSAPRGRRLAAMMGQQYCLHRTHLRRTRIREIGRR